jgi:hypothetical protein
LKSKIHTVVECHGNAQLDFCTYHYYMMRGKEGGYYSLESYVEASRLHSFRTSLPSRDEMALLRLKEKD